MGKFVEWIKIREQINPPQPGGQKNIAALKDDGAKIDARIKQTIAANIKKPKQNQKAALENLGKQIAANPGSTPKDIKKIADLMAAEEDPGQ